MSSDPSRPRTDMACYTPQFLQAQKAYIGNTLRGKNGLHAFGNNSTESEPIWMKSGIV